MEDQRRTGGGQSEPAGGNRRKRDKMARGGVGSKLQVKGCRLGPAGGDLAAVAIQSGQRLESVAESGCEVLELGQPADPLRSRQSAIRSR